MKKQYPMGAALLLIARKRAGLKQKDFIERHQIEVTQATYSRWENGVIQVPFDVLLKLELVNPVEIF